MIKEAWAGEGGGAGNKEQSSQFVQWGFQNGSKVVRLFPHMLGIIYKLLVHDVNFTEK